MSQYRASQSIIRYLHHSGLQPDEYISITDLSDLMMEGGMSLDELEAGLILAIREAWIQSLDEYIGLTEEGFLRYEPANDNNYLRLFL